MKIQQKKLIYDYCQCFINKKKQFFFLVDLADLIDFER